MPRRPHRKPSREFRRTSSSVHAPRKRAATREQPSRRPAVRLGLRGILPPDIERGAPEMTVFQSRIKRIFVDDRRPRDIDQQRARLHQGKAAGVDQPFRFRRQPAGDKDRVAQRQHAIELGQGEDSFRRRGIGDRAAVGGEDTAF